MWTVAEGRATYGNAMPTFSIFYNLLTGSPPPQPACSLVIGLKLCGRRGKR